MHKVLEYLKQHQKRFLTDLCDYLRFASVSAQPQHKGDVQACAEWLVAHCQKIGLQAQLRPTAGHPIVIAKTPRTGGGSQATLHGLRAL
jgi:acetylornithine deacetylase/succinyl-diaminopimelate desuccinylase-like protein